MRRQSITAVAVAFAVSVFSGCGSEPPGLLEIGVQDQASGDFMPLGADDTVSVVTGANGLNMIVPSLMAVGIDPAGPDPDVIVTVNGIFVAAVIQGDNADMAPEDDGFVLWDLRVPFDVDLCCYECSVGLISASLEDQSGHAFEGEVSVLLTKAGICPNPSSCCVDASRCPDPSLVRLCE